MLTELHGAQADAGRDRARAHPVHDRHRDAGRAQGADHPLVLRAPACSASRWKPTWRRASPSSTSRRANTLQREAIDAVLALATRNEASPEGRALTAAIRYAAEERFDELLRGALRLRPRIEEAVRLESGNAADGLRVLEVALRQTLKVRPNATEDTVTKRARANRRRWRAAALARRALRRRQERHRAWPIDRGRALGRLAQGARRRARAASSAPIKGRRARA